MTEKKIETLVEDMEAVLNVGVKEVDPKITKKYADLFSDMLSNRIKPREPRERGTLRMSNIGKPCERQLWYEVNHPNDAEPLQAHTKLKFLFGDVTEILLLYLAEVSGHKVEGTQDVSEIQGIKGHRDGVIDGVVVDVKSASEFAYKKFKEGTLANNDSFGYLGQIQSYGKAGENDPLVTQKNKVAFLAFDKSQGHFCLDEHPAESEGIEEFYEERKAMVEQPELPERAFVDVPEGKSGNMKLGTNCSYCSHKWSCWPDLRGFKYSNGPVFLTKVERVPNVPEIENPLHKEELND